MTSGYIFLQLFLNTCTAFFTLHNFNVSAVCACRRVALVNVTTTLVLDVKTCSDGQRLARFPIRAPRFVSYDADMAEVHQVTDLAVIDCGGQS